MRHSLKFYRNDVDPIISTQDDLEVIEAIQERARAINERLEEERAYARQIMQADDD